MKCEVSHPCHYVRTRGGDNWLGMGREKLADTGNGQTKGGNLDLLLGLFDITVTNNANSFSAELTNTETRQYFCVFPLAITVALP